MPHEVRFSKTAFKDVQDLTSRLRKKLRSIIEGQLMQDPYIGKRLVGDLAGLYSLRLSFKDRIVYSVDEAQKIIYIHRSRTQYGE